MYKKVTAFLIFLFLALPITALAVKPETTILVWYSFRTNTNFAFFESYETRGKWIVPDVGWFDFGKPWNYREVFAGGGYIPVKNNKITFAVEGLFLQGTGVSGNRPNFFVPLLSSEIKISKKLSWNTAYFGRVPLNDTAYGSHSLDRSKFLWQFSNHFAAGGGYAGDKINGYAWQNKPFISAKFFTTNYGDLEIWFQRLPHLYTIQLRLNKNR